jgi:polar amino acid transport system substrate-binding protein
VLEKDSPLTECVNQAIQAIKDDGTLDGLEQEWLTGSAPVLE